jgi:hypothetical protein
MLGLIKRTRIRAELHRVFAGHVEKFGVRAALELGAEPETLEMMWGLDVL